FSQIVSEVLTQIQPVVLKRNKATNTFYKGVIAASVICFTVSLFVSYGHFSNIFHWGGSTNVEYIEN
ncbi:TPA: helix-turn-helix domain-containing protein, partial [Enterococcus faecium]